MKFGPVPLDRAHGHILGHNVTDEDGRRRLRKGRALRDTDLDTLRALGIEQVYVARLEPGDVDENDAAGRVATQVAGSGLRLSPARTGRVNVYAVELGVLRIDLDRLQALHRCEGVTLATLPRFTPVRPERMAATLKVIPYALPTEAVAQACAVGEEEPVLSVVPFTLRRVALVLSGSAGAESRIVHGFREALRLRLEALGATIETVDYVALGPYASDTADEARLAATLTRRIDGGAELVILAGETAIMDRHDVTPRAVERAGGSITGFGMPVDPGNLLLLGYRGAVPILGAPGCARSPKTNVVDLVLPRLLAGERLSRDDLLALGHGGLLDDVPERPLPRSWLT